MVRTARRTRSEESDYSDNDSIADPSRSVVGPATKRRNTMSFDGLDHVSNDEDAQNTELPVNMEELSVY